jgi:hypothetical protein
MTTRRSLFSVLSGLLALTILPKKTIANTPKPSINSYLHRRVNADAELLPSDFTLWSDENIIARLREVHEANARHFARWGDEFPSKTLWLEAAERLEKIRQFDKRHEAPMVAAWARYRLLPALCDYRVNGPDPQEVDLIISGSYGLDILVEIPGCKAVVRHRLFTYDEIAQSDNYVAEFRRRLKQIL